MNNLGWAISIVALVIVGGFIAYCRWAIHPSKPKYVPGAFILSEDVASCGGCGCLLLKGPQFKQPSTVENATRCHAGGIYLLPPNTFEWIMEHYLCLRCQVDGTPPAREMKPC